MDTNLEEVDVEMLPFIELLGEGAKSVLVQNLIVFGFMWHVIKKTVNEHFNKIESSLDRIAASIEKHEQRIGDLEEGLTKITKGK